MPVGSAQERMVEEQLRARGIRDGRVLDAFGSVPRHLFVPPEAGAQAYEDRPLPIGAGQTISQPFMVACMSEALGLAGGEKILEVGTGSGYQAAILAKLGASVYSIERIAELSNFARTNLERAGFPDVRFRVGDGTLGWKEEAPFDRIVVTAGAPSVPVALIGQLREGGSMIIPVGGQTEQELLVLRREDGLVKKTRICSCVFVKLVGQEGW